VEAQAIWLAVVKALTVYAIIAIKLVISRRTALRLLVATSAKVLTTLPEIAISLTLEEKEGKGLIEEIVMKGREGEIEAIGAIEIEEIGIEGIGEMLNAMNAMKLDILLRIVLQAKEETQGLRQEEEIAITVEKVATFPEIVIKGKKEIEMTEERIENVISAKSLGILQENVLWKISN